MSKPTKTIKEQRIGMLFNQMWITLFIGFLLFSAVGAVLMAIFGVHG